MDGYNGTHYECKDLRLKHFCLVLVIVSASTFCLILDHVNWWVVKIWLIKFVFQVNSNKSILYLYMLWNNQTSWSLRVFEDYHHWTAWEGALVFLCVYREKNFLSIYKEDPIQCNWNTYFDCIIKEFTQFMWIYRPKTNWIYFQIFQKEKENHLHKKF